MFFPENPRFASYHKPKFYTFFLAIFWILGFCLGICLSLSASENIFSLMPILLTGNVSIVGMLIVFTFPFIIAVVLTHLSLRNFLYLLGFVKSFCFSFASSCIFLSFRSAGWLMCALIMFSDLILSVLFFWFLLRCITGNSNMYIIDTAFCTVITAAVVCVNYYLITPFLLSLM